MINLLEGWRAVARSCGRSSAESFAAIANPPWTEDELRQAAGVCIQNAREAFSTETELEPGTVARLSLYAQEAFLERLLEMAEARAEGGSA